MNTKDGRFCLNKLSTELGKVKQKIGVVSAEVMEEVAAAIAAVALASPHAIAAAPVDLTPAQMRVFGEEAVKRGYGPAPAA